MKRFALRPQKGLFAAAGLTLALGLASCDKQTKDSKESPSDNNMIKTEFTSWEQFPSAEGCKLSASYPQDSTDAVSRNIREWINEQLGGKYDGSLNDGKKLIEHYGKERAAKIEADIKEFGENSAMGKSAYYMQFKKAFETGKFVTYTVETYTYAGGAHGAESRYGQVFRKPDGRMFGWDMFTKDGKEKLRGLIKEHLQRVYFKTDNDDEFYDMLLAENARYQFPLPETAPILRPNGVEFIYQQYELAPYSAGIPSCILPYKAVQDLFTTTMKPLLESTTDSIAAVSAAPRL